MYPEAKDSLALLREPIYFYYSGCYYENNKDRMHKRYQVGRGGRSWDVGISDLKLKREPKLDLAMKVMTEGIYPLSQKTKFSANLHIQTKLRTPASGMM
jgi:hypothetical protein